MDPFHKVPPGYAPLPEPQGVKSSFVQAPVDYLAPPLFQAAPVEYLAPQVVHSQPVQPHGAFYAHISSNRHHKFVVMRDFELVFSRDESPTLFFFSPAPIEGSYLISTVWAPAPASAPLVLERPVSPAFVRAQPGAGWRVSTGLDPSGEEYLWRIEQRGGAVALRCVASGRFAAAESRCLRADRPVAAHWEEFALLPPRQAHQVPASVDALLTGAVRARFRVRSRRYGKVLGVRGPRLCFTEQNSVFEIIPAAPGLVRLHCAHDPALVWMVRASDEIVFVGALESSSAGASLFSVERGDDEEHSWYCVRSAANGRVCVALCIGLRANRSHKQAWEHLALELL